MKNILLCCAAGMSTSLLVTKMKKSTENMGIESKIWAVAIEDLENHLNEADVVLLGPQIRYKLSTVKKICSEKNVPVDVINTMDYGSMNGEKVVNHALKLIG
jgi:PTS system cellobiose-specific IIB component